MIGHARACPQIGDGMIWGGLPHYPIPMPWQGDPKAKEDAGPAAWLGKPMGFLQAFFLKLHGNMETEVQMFLNLLIFCKRQFSTCFS